MPNIHIIQTNNQDKRKMAGAFGFAYQLAETNSTSLLIHVGSIGHMYTDNFGRALDENIQEGLARKISKKVFLNQSPVSIDITSKVEEVENHHGVLLTVWPPERELIEFEPLTNLSDIIVLPLHESEFLGWKGRKGVQFRG